MSKKVPKDQYEKTLSYRMLQWYEGEKDPFLNTVEMKPQPEFKEDKDVIEKRERERKRLYEHIYDMEHNAKVRAFRKLYRVFSVIFCIALVLVLLTMVSYLPTIGEVSNPVNNEVSRRYIENGLQETGAVNIVTGMILDYRAFDTLGESHVLFTALVCVLILLRIDTKNQMTGYEDYYTVRTDSYFDLSGDPILRLVCAVIIPCVLLYGIYIILNGQNSPGGGFSGGAVLGAGLILFSTAFGFDKVDRLFSLKVSNIVTFVSLAFYSFAKGYVFFMGANGLDAHIPKGTPGAIFSGGMILPLDIAVGCVVGCTMFGFYSLFRRGSVGGQL